MDNTLDKAGHGMEHKRVDKDVEFRFAKPQDIPLILRFIRELADYEGMLDQVVATEELLNQWLFEKEKAEVILGLSLIHIDVYKRQLQCHGKRSFH